MRYADEYAKDHGLILLFPNEYGNFDMSPNYNCFQNHTGKSEGDIIARWENKKRKVEADVTKVVAQNGIFSTQKSTATDSSGASHQQTIKKN